MKNMFCLKQLVVLSLMYILYKTNECIITTSVITLFNKLRKKSYMIIPL